MTLRLFAFAAVVILVAGTAPADEKDERAKAVADAAASEVEKLDGTWTATAGTRDGKAVPKDELAKLSLTLTRSKSFFGNTTSLVPFLPPDTMNAAAVVWGVAPGATPRAITFSRHYGARASDYPGIYELNRDALTLCADFTPSPDGPPMRKRPTKFDAPKGSPYTLLNFTRAKP